MHTQDPRSNYRRTAATLPTNLLIKLLILCAVVMVAIFMRAAPAEARPLWTTAPAVVPALPGDEDGRPFQRTPRPAAPRSRYDRFRLGVQAYADQQFITALSLLRPLAYDDHRSAQYYLALMYDQGVGVLQDKERAAHWYEQAARNGHAGAQYNLGVALASGEGINSNMSDAVRWWERAAELGNVDAQYNLGMVYFNGDGVQRSTAVAIRWWGAAAKNGDATAQYNLGVIYAQGDGVEKDLCEAARWWHSAADQGFQRAIMALVAVDARTESDSGVQGCLAAQNVDDA